MPEWVKNPIFTKGSAKIACIVDYHEEVVNDKESASRIQYSPNGEVTYFKEGKLEVIAHSETILDSNSGVIVCKKNKYEVIRKKKLLGFEIAELYENNHSIAKIKTRLFWSKSIFKKDLPLNDRIFITLLSFDWWWRHRQKKNENQIYAGLYLLICRWLASR